MVGAVVIFVDIRHQQETFCIARGHPYNPPHYYLAAADRDDNKRESPIVYLNMIIYVNGKNHISLATSC